MGDKHHENPTNHSFLMKSGRQYFAKCSIEKFRLNCLVFTFFCFNLTCISCTDISEFTGTSDSLISVSDTFSDETRLWTLRYLYHFEDNKDSLRLLMYFGKETSMNYHRIEETRIELQRKIKSVTSAIDKESWETILTEESVVNDHDTLRFLGMYGDYAVFENEGVAVYSGGFMDHYLSYLLIRNQKILPSAAFSAIIEHDNHATSECIQSLDQNNGCDCIRTFGKHTLSYDIKQRWLVFEFEERREWGVEASCKDTAGIGVVDYYKAVCTGDSCRELQVR